MELTTIAIQLAFPCHVKRKTPKTNTDYCYSNLFLLVFNNCNEQIMYLTVISQYIIKMHNHVTISDEV